MSSRELNDWLTGYLEFTKNSEPPISYHTWVGISLIAGALQRRVHLRWGHDKIYPNMYVVLVGPSGKCRKGTAMNLGKSIVTDIGTLVMTSESVTREALIRCMASATNNYSDPSEGNNMVFHSSLTAFSEELSVFLGQNNVKFLADLTDWYDSRDQWTYETKNSGTDKITGVCFNFLGATAPDWLQSILPEEAVGGGFTSRIIFVVEENKGKTIPYHELTEFELELKKKLRNDLERVINIAGSMEFAPAAKELYIQWYTKQEELIRKNTPPLEDPRFSGYCDRRATHVRKLAMIMSASRGDSMILEVQDFNRALALLEAAEVKMPKVFGGLGRNQHSAVIEKVINFIKQHGKVKRSLLMHRFYRDVDPNALKSIEEVLVQMKLVAIKRDHEHGESTYEYIGTDKG